MRRLRSTRTVSFPANARLIWSYRCARCPATMMTCRTIAGWSSCRWAADGLPSRRRGRREDEAWPINLESDTRSEEHTSELQSHSDLVCRLLLEKKKIKDQ